MDSPLYRRAAAQVPRMARRMIDAFVVEVPFYAALPRELLDGEVADIAMSNLRIFHRSLREDRVPTPQELAEQAESAARRAQERFPLDALLAVCHIGARVGLEMLGELAGPEDTDDLVAAAPRAVRYLQAMIPVVADAYLQEQQAIHGEDREARRALVEALLAGEPAEPLAERVDLDLAACYVVLVLRVAPVKDPAGESAGEPAGRGVWARRTVRLIQRELDQRGLDQRAGDRRAGDQRVGFRRALPVPGHVLSALDGSGGTVLLAASPGTVEAELAALPELVERIAAATGAKVIAGNAVGDGLQSVPAAAREAAEVAELAERLGRPSGPYRLDDVLLEHQLSLPGPARERLAGLLAPLAGHPHLLEAVRAYVECGYNRHQAAAHIHVHRNTLNYRLRRVETLTGIDPADPVGSRVLAAALITHDVVENATQIER
ncbi:helix-turn-helix domain-containing protein [Actinomadura barringtoniae]|uniref:Helix-turn-helix domain-containing protein n=1 Tax=Actinomadura barringtoniae TaxID=1427535 RepID=A0A939T679_9ACTN|nr:helix-turn-helix domain-containing protein [Actinomadura barringtoniae]MBO2451598.1 helix-turn-helix domain-containing protein [Actinomadura barringtoniae]